MITIVLFVPINAPPTRYMNQHDALYTTVYIMIAAVSIATGIAINSLRPGDAYMRRWTGHHWFR